MATSLLLVLYCLPRALYGLCISNGAPPDQGDTIAAGLRIFNDACLPRDTPKVQDEDYASPRITTPISLQPIKGPAEGTSSNIVLFFTTHLSSQHISFLRCLPSKMFANTSMLAHADVIVQTFGVISPEVRNLLAAFPNQIVRIADLGDNPDKQKGAMKGVAEAFRNGWLTSYEWAIRLNPDVVIWSEAPLMTAMFPKNTWGIFAICDLRGRINTDFFAIRPRRVSHTAFSDWNDWGNAEEQATHEFKFVIDSHHEFLLQPSGIGDGKCRIRGGGVWHDQLNCDDRFKLQPWLNTRLAELPPAC